MCVVNSETLHLPDASRLVDQIMATMEQVGHFIFIFYLPPNLGKGGSPPAIQLKLV
jgi:hypothetical protein